MELGTHIGMKRCDIFVVVHVGYLMFMHDTNSINHMGCLIFTSGLVLQCIKTQIHIGGLDCRVYSKVLMWGWHVQSEIWF